MSVQRVSVALLREHRKGQKRHKYHAKPMVIDGVRFDSTAEAKRYGELKLLERVGKISSLILQPVYRIFVMPMLHDRRTTWIKVGEYRGDFQYWDEPNGQTVVEDVKGAKTPLYRLKKKLVEAQYGIQIRET